MFLLLPVDFFPEDVIKADNQKREVEFLEPTSPISPGKTDRQHRNRLLSKLTYSGVLKQQTRKSNNLIVFDWDDTFFPTTAFQPRTENEMVAIKTKHAELFSRIDKLVL